MSKTAAKNMPCPQCHGTGFIENGICQTCGAKFEFSGAKLEISGTNYKHVLVVAGALIILVVALLASLSFFGISLLNT